MMVRNINVEGLNPKQIKEIQAMVEALKAKNKPNKNKPEIDIIDYLLENPLNVDNLEFMRRKDIYDRKK